MEARIRQQRKSKKLNLKKITYIYCNGVTEKHYFEELQRYYNISTKVCVIKSSHSNRLSLVKEVEKKHENIKKDDTQEVFIVFDADIMPKGQYSNPKTTKSQVDNACNKCNAKGYTAIVSNESFELWFLLHFKDIKAKIHRDDIYDKLKSCIPDYTKGMNGMFEKTFHLIDTAKARAKKLDQNKEAPYLRSERNPSTNVYELIEKIESLKNMSS